MSNSSESKLIAMNAGLLAGAALLSFVLPMITESVTDGRANFAKAMAQMIPLLAAIPLSCSLLGKALSHGRDLDKGE